MLLGVLSSVRNLSSFFPTQSLLKAALCFASGFSLVALCFAAPIQSQPADAAKRAPAVTVQPIDLNGLKTLFKRDPAKPRPLLVNFWATWCDPCREEFPELVKIDKDYRDKGLEFVAISLDDVAEIKEGVPQFLGKMGATMPAFLLSDNDPGPAITFVDPNWSGALPATLLYDREGKIVYKHFGRFKDAELRAAIEKAIKCEDK